jgi:hypothetical protein
LLGSGVASVEVVVRAVAVNTAVHPTTKRRAFVSRARGVAVFFEIARVAEQGWVIAHCVVLPPNAVMPPFNKDTAPTQTTHTLHVD